MVPQSALQVLANRRGGASIEYALIAALISVMLIGVVTTVGQKVLQPFEKAAAILGP